NHQILSSLPPLPEGREVDERTIINDESQESTPPETEVAGSHKSAASSDKDTELDASESVRSPPSNVSPRNKRKRNETEDSGASKPAEPAAEESSLDDGDDLDPYGDAGSVSSNSHDRGFFASPPTNGGYVDSTTQPPSAFSEKTQASLQQAEERAEALEAKLKISEEARAKAQADADSIEELRQRLSKAETALRDKIAEQISRDQGIIDRRESQSRHFFPGRNDESFELLAPKDDRLCDAPEPRYFTFSGTNLLTRCRSAFLFSAVFGFRNPSKEIFSELDEINARVLFLHEASEVRRGDEWGHEADTRAARPGPGPRRLWCRHLVTPFDLPFRLLKASVAKPPVPRATIRKTLLRGRRRQSHLGDSGDRLRHPAGEGIITGGALYHHARLRIDA
ncbi:hypothetical protein QYE76_072017, partial [Lolium multiflorum]